MSILTKARGLLIPSAAVEQDLVSSAGSHVVMWRFIQHFGTPYLFSWIEIGPARVRIKVARAVLGVIPAGRNWVSVPSTEIARSDIRWKLYLGRALSLIAIVGILAYLSPPLWLIVPAGAALAWMSLGTVTRVLQVHLRDGGLVQVPFCIFERLDAELVGMDLVRVTERGA